jgi:uncharacterized protein (DUF433 family)
MGGTPVFAGTRVPFQTLLDYIEAGDPLSEFLEDFPTVKAELAVAALEQAKEALFASAYSASGRLSATEFLKSLPPGTRSAKEIDDEFRETRADRL